MNTVLPATRNGLRKQRHLLVAAAAAACLALTCGSVEAARMWMPKAENPYCDVPTYMLRDLPEQALSMRDSSGKPAIVVSQYTLADHPAYSRFLLAHECCHHSLGHMERFGAGLGQVGPQPFFYVAPALKQMELDADCCAVKLLKANNETDGIESASETMMSFGSAQTGAYYPTGIERAENIAKCAAQE